MPVTNPKLCECGCGQPAPIATRSEPSRGYIKGEPRRFITGHNRKPVSVEERFWPKVDRGGPNECWEWQASTNKGGYGDFPALGQRAAHRVSYVLEHGDRDLRDLRDTLEFVVTAHHATRKPSKLHTHSDDFRECVCNTCKRARRALDRCREPGTWAEIYGPHSAPPEAGWPKEGA